MLIALPLQSMTCILHFCEEGHRAENVDVSEAAAETAHCECPHENDTTEVGTSLDAHCSELPENCHSCQIHSVRSYRSALDKRGPTDDFKRLNRVVVKVLPLISYTSRTVDVRPVKKIPLPNLDVSERLGVWLI